MHPGDLAAGFSDLEMTWLLYCASAATVRRTQIQLLHMLIKSGIDFPIYSHVQIIA